MVTVYLSLCLKNAMLLTCAHQVPGTLHVVLGQVKRVVAHTQHRPQERADSSLQGSEKGAAGVRQLIWC